MNVLLPPSFLPFLRPPLPFPSLPSAGIFTTITLYNHDRQEGRDQERRHVRGHAAGRGGLCHPGHGEVQHREGHCSLHQEGETGGRIPSGASLGFTSVAHDLQIIRASFLLFYFILLFLISQVYFRPLWRGGSL